MSKKPVFERVVDPSPAAGKRETVEETAERLIDGKKRIPTLTTEKLTTYVFAEQKKRMRETIAEFRRQNPRAPRVTEAEIVRLALDRLPWSDGLDELIKAARG